MKYEISLSEADVQSIINGREIYINSSDGTEFVIRQSYLKDMAAPVLIDRFEVKDNEAERVARSIRQSFINPFESGAR